jgi:hypothetical protein
LGKRKPKKSDKTQRSLAETFKKKSSSGRATTKKSKAHKKKKKTSKKESSSLAITHSQKIYS